MSGDVRKPDDGELSQVLVQLQEERVKLRKLQELHALKLANHSNQEELEGIIAEVQEVQGETIRLTLKVEEFTGLAGDLESKISALNLPKKVDGDSNP